MAWTGRNVGQPASTNGTPDPAVAFVEFIPSRVRAAAPMMERDHNESSPIAAPVAVPTREIAVKFPWHKYKSVMDVGTAQGCLPVEITKAEDQPRRLDHQPAKLFIFFPKRGYLHVINTTKVSYSVESTPAGKLGSIGRPVLRAKAEDMEKQFASRLRAAFASPAEGAAR